MSQKIFYIYIKCLKDIH